MITVGRLEAIYGSEVRWLCVCVGGGHSCAAVCLSGAEEGLRHYY